MLTSSQDLIPQSVTPMEDNVHCAVHHDKPQPQTICQSSVLHSCEANFGSLSPRRRSGRLLRNKEQTEECIRSDSSAKTPKQWQENASLNNKERGYLKTCDDNDIEDQEPRYSMFSGRMVRDNTLRSCKRKLELSSVTQASHVSKDSSAVQEHIRSTQYLEPKCPESPPPAKRWVIGPLLQSFKSKMASFTEIVMSPVRLFKHNDSLISNTQPDHHVQLSDSNCESSSASKEEQAEDGKCDVFSKREQRYTPLKVSPVIKMFRFNTSSSNTSDPVENKVADSPDRSETQGDGLLGLSQSIMKTDSSLNALSPRDLASHVEEPIGASDLQKQTSYGKPVYEHEVEVTTSAPKQNDCSNSSQEKSVFTKPRLILSLTDTADTINIKPSRLEAPHLNSSSCSFSFTEDADKKDTIDPEESILRMPLRSPRKRSQLSESQGLSPVKSTNKTSVTLSKCRILDDAAKDLRYFCNSIGHAQPFSKDNGVATTNYDLERKRKKSPKTETVRSLEKNEVVTKVTSCSKRSKKEGKVDSVEESSVLHISKRMKVHVCHNLPLSNCKAKDVDMTGFIPEKSGSFESLEREKLGQERASRRRSNRHAKFRTPAALGFENNASDNSSSSDTMKSALKDSSLQGNYTNVTYTSGNNESTSAEAHPSIKSTRPQRILHDECSDKSVKHQKTRWHKVNSNIMVCKDGKIKDLIVRLERHSDQPKVPLRCLAGQSGEAFVRDEQLDLQELDSSTNEEKTMLRRNNIQQANHKLETSFVTSDVAPSGVAVKNLLVPSKRSGKRAVKKSVHAVEEQRVSMSLTLQVGAEVDEQNGDIQPPVQCGSSTQWEAARQFNNCRITRRMGKMAAQETTDVASFFGPKSTTVHLKNKAFDEENNGCLGKCGTLSREQKKSKVDRQRRKCVSLAKRKDAQEDEEQTLNPAEEAVPAVVSSGSSSIRLLRSFSCPDIPSLLHSDHAPSVSLHDHIRRSPKKVCPVPLQAHHPHSPSKRARRHTVCSMEIEREIAPLCLRKEVHPTASNHMYPYSHSSSLTALASCFLSSPLAFLSKKSSYGYSDDIASASQHSFTKTPSPSFLKFPTSPTLTINPAFSASVPPTPEQSSASVSSPCSVFEPVPMVADVGHQESEEERSSFSLDLSSRAISEEKALSDSEIKADDKQVEQRKVSSIRIRKTLPKPQHNLTPMGLPKAIRIKKKVFTVEEIYTNKNYSKPPEGRLETIFEVPLSRRDGSESLIGQKRVKRFIEFPELGVARKPRKPLVGGAGLGGAQRKTAGNSGVGRTRRGVWASSKDENALNLQHLDSLLCSKLNELDSWMMLEQMVY